MREGTSGFWVTESNGKITIGMRITACHSLAAEILKEPTI